MFLYMPHAEIALARAETHEAEQASVVEAAQIVLSQAREELSIRQSAVQAIRAQIDFDKSVLASIAAKDAGEAAPH